MFKSLILAAFVALAFAGATVASAHEAIEDDVEQTQSIGSQSSGAGAGKVTFNPF